MSPQYLNIAEMISHTRSEGPGCRFALWLQGCAIRCPGCCNPKMQAMNAGRHMHIRIIVDMIRVSGLTDISILGGEPLDQIDSLLNFIALLNRENIGIMVFTGYTMDQIKHNGKQKKILSKIDLIKTGPFIKEYRSTRVKWIGSGNQVFHHLTDRYKHHPDFKQEHTQSVSISLTKDQVVISGTPLDLSLNPNPGVTP